MKMNCTLLIDHSRLSEYPIQLITLKRAQERDFSVCCIFERQNHGGYYRGYLTSPDRSQYFELIIPRNQRFFIENPTRIDYIWKYV